MKKLLFLLLVGTFLCVGSVYGHKKLEGERGCDKDDRTCCNNVEDHNHEHLSRYQKAKHDYRQQCYNIDGRVERKFSGDGLAYYYCYKNNIVKSRLRDEPWDY